MREMRSVRRRRTGRIGRGRTATGLKDQVASADALHQLCMSQWRSMGSCFLMVNTGESMLTVVKVIYSISQVVSLGPVSN